jgi:hypothetical protein
MKKRFAFLFLVVLNMVLMSSIFSQEKSSLGLPSHICHKNNTEENSTLIELYNRGISLFAEGEYAQSCEDFSCVINSPESSEELLGAALWGRAWVNACLGQNENLIEDLAAIAVQVGLYEPCECSSPTSIAFSGNAYQQGPFQLVNYYRQVDSSESGHEFCFNTVDNCSTFMVAMCAIVKDRGARVTLALFIDALAEKAKSCCRAGGFWRGCVQKMVDTMNKWKMLGIPPDPYWD